MKRGLVLALSLALGALLALALALPMVNVGVRPASAQATQCALFPKLSEEAAKRAALVQNAMKTKADRKEICTLMTSFVAAEGVVVKFLEDNKTWCGVPDVAITNSKASHEKSMKFKTAACNSDVPHAKTPTLSDAIRTPSVDSTSNTKVGKGGTFDTLTGNPLGK
jgi:hypothetical protein